MSIDEIKFQRIKHIIELINIKNVFNSLAFLSLTRNQFFQQTNKQ